MRTGFLSLALALVALSFGTSAPAAPAQPVTLLFTGDNCLGGSMATQIARHGAAHPYAQVTALLNSYDFVFGNLECPLTRSTAQTLGKSPALIAEGREFVFKGDPNAAAIALRDAGFDFLSVANNHAMDYRALGLVETLAALRAVRITPGGGGHNISEAMSPRIVVVEGIRIGILCASMINPIGSPATAASPGIYCLPKGWTPGLEEQLTTLRPKCDLMVLSLHWGVEGTTQPTVYQRDIATRAVALGTDLVVGHHPHVLQPVVRQGKSVISYSLGNFCMTSPATNQRSAALELHATRDGITEVRLLPLAIASGRPSLTSEPQIAAFVGRLSPGVPLGPAHVQSTP